MLYLCVALLCFAVLSWGTEYKCSIYLSPSQGEAQLQPAKLLSQKERPPQSKRIGIEADPSKSPIAPRSCACFFVASASETSSNLRTAGIATRPGCPCPCRQIASLAYFTFRPPPAQSRFPRRKSD
jgi:hypothetical protein